jgi:hypothetical protein
VIEHAVKVHQAEPVDVADKVAVCLHERQGGAEGIRQVTDSLKKAAVRLEELEKTLGALHRDLEPALGARVVTDQRKGAEPEGARRSGAKIVCPENRGPAFHRDVVETGMFFIKVPTGDHLRIIHVKDRPVAGQAAFFGNGAQQAAVEARVNGIPEHFTRKEHADRREGGPLDSDDFGLPVAEVIPIGGLDDPLDALDEGVFPGLGRLDKLDERALPHQAHRAKKVTDVFP